MNPRIARCMWGIVTVFVTAAAAASDVIVETDCAGRIAVVADGHAGAARDGKADSLFLFSRLAPLTSTFRYVVPGANLDGSDGRLRMTTPNASFCLDVSVAPHGDPPPTCAVTVYFNSGSELTRYDHAGVEMLDQVEPCGFPGFLNPLGASCGGGGTPFDCDSGGPGSVGCGVGGCTTTPGEPSSCNTSCGQGFFCCSGREEKNEPCGPPPGQACKKQLASCRCCPSS